MQKVRLFHHVALEIFDLKILQSDWSKAFWTIYQEPEFPQIWDLFIDTVINTNFHYRPNWEKIKNQIFLYIKRTLGVAYFPNFSGKTFPKNLALSSTTTHGPLTPCWVPEKIRSQFQENVQTEGLKDFINRTLLAMASDPVRE